MSSRPILLTGGAGYIGSICATELIAQGHEVTIVDNLSTGHRKSVPAGARFYECDIGDSARLNEVISEHGCDAVFHFAARALVSESMLDPGLYYRENVSKALTMLDCVRQAGVRKFVFSSTAATYGNPLQNPISEDHPQQPVNAYGASKLSFEHILHWYAHAYGFSAVVFRYFNAAGATSTLGEWHDLETHAVPLLLQTASGRRAQFDIYGTDYDTPDGSCVRDFVHVLDIAQAHLLALKKLEEPGFHAYNIGSSNPCSVSELCRIVEEVTGSKLNVRHAPRRTGDPAILCASARRLHDELGWTPCHSDLHNIIETAWEWEQRQTALVGGKATRT